MTAAAPVAMTTPTPVLVATPVPYREPIPTHKGGALRGLVMGLLGLYVVAAPVAALWIAVSAL